MQVMITFRVDDLDALLATLLADGVAIVPERSDDPHGRFAWIIDCEGNRIELRGAAACEVSRAA